MVDWATALGLKPGSFFAGMLGGVLSLRWVPEVGWAARSFTIFFAGCVANYATEPIYLTFAIKGLHQGGVGLLIGLFAMSLSAAIFKALKELQLGTMVTNFIGKLLGVQP
ncbi:MAG: hypothetical protein ACREI9_05620 [Nitrospiraceae bacterium]